LNAIVIPSAERDCHPERSEGSARWRSPKLIWSRARGARAPASRGERSRSKRAALATPYRRSASSASEKQHPLRGYPLVAALLGMTSNCHSERSEESAFILLTTDPSLSLRMTTG